MSIERRAFLRAAAFGAAGIAVACSKGGPVALFPSPFESVGRDIARRATHGLQVFAGGQVFLRGDAVRLPLGIADKDGTSVTGESGKVWVGQGASAQGPVPLAYRTYGRTAPGDPLGFHVATTPIPWTGLVDVLVEARGLYGTTTVNVTAKGATPEPGARATPVATPTVGALRGVKTLCTRSPTCSMHEVRLDRVLGSGTPVVFTISSPKLCTSRTCGPVVDEVLSVKSEHGGRALFIHAEVYKGDTPTQLSPASQAWKLLSEPWTWVIDGEGIVRARFEGPVVASEITPELTTLL